MTDIINRKYKNQKWFKTISAPNQSLINISSLNIDQLYQYAHSFTVGEWENLTKKNTKVPLKFIIDNLHYMTGVDFTKVNYGLCDYNETLALCYQYLHRFRLHFKKMKYFETNVLNHPNMNLFIQNKSYKTCFTLQIVMKYPELEWDYYDISSDHIIFNNFAGHHIPFSFFKKNFHKNWNFQFIHNLVRIPFILTFVSKHMDKQWDWSYLLKKNFFLGRSIFKGKKNINWNHLSKYISIHGINHFHYTFVEENLDKSWDWHYLTKHVTRDLIFRNLDKSWDWNYICSEFKSHITMEIYENHKSKINHQLMSSPDKHQTNIKQSHLFKIVKKYPYESWDWRELIDHKNFDFKLIETVTHVNWKFYSNQLSKHSNLNWKLIIQTPDIWNYHILSKHPKIEMKVVEKLSHEKWSWHELSRHPNLTPYLFNKYQNKQWYKPFILGNQNFLKKLNQEEELKKRIAKILLKISCRNLTYKIYQYLY